MHSGKRYSIIKTLQWTSGPILLFLVFDSIPVTLYYYFECTWLAVPWQPMSVIGIAVAFYLGFKNNSSYERLWEARKIWGGIVNASRTFTVMTRDFVSNQFSGESFSGDELDVDRKRIVHRHVAWLYALTFQLRKVQKWEHDNDKDNQFRKAMGTDMSNLTFDEIRPYISEEEFDYLMTKGNKASHLLSLQSKDIQQLRAKGKIDDFRHMEFKKMIEELYALQGKSERIKNFPFPRQYASANFFFVCIFIFLLPFGLLSVFDNPAHKDMLWLTIPFSVLASWVFLVMEKIGDYSENPFEGLYNDVPIYSMARGIEIDIRQMLEETDLPDAIKPTEEYEILV